VYCQWLPLHQLDDRSIRMIVRTFLDVFEEAELWWLRCSVETPVVGLVGRGPGAGSTLEHHSLTPLPPARALALDGLDLADPLQLQGLYIGNRPELEPFAANAPLNTDDRPAVVFSAPSVLHEAPADLVQRVRAILGISRAAMHRLGSNGPGVASPPEARLLPFRMARDRYIEGLLAELEDHESAAIDAWVESAGLSPDFTSAYARCLTLASAWLAPQPERARALLQRLAEAQPGIPVARRMLERLRQSDGQPAPATTDNPPAGIR
jgi:spermidine synthase